MPSIQSSTSRTIHPYCWMKRRFGRPWVFFRGWSPRCCNQFLRGYQKGETEREDPMRLSAEEKYLSGHCRNTFGMLPEQWKYQVWCQTSLTRRKRRANQVTACEKSNWDSSRGDSMYLVLDIVFTNQLSIVPTGTLFPAISNSFCWVQVTPNLLRLAPVIVDRAGGIRQDFTGWYENGVDADS